MHSFQTRRSRGTGQFSTMISTRLARDRRRRARHEAGTRSPTFPKEVRHHLPTRSLPLAPLPAAANGASSPGSLSRAKRPINCRVAARPVGSVRGVEHCEECGFTWGSVAEAEVAARIAAGADAIADVPVWDGPPGEPAFLAVLHAAHATDLTRRQPAVDGPFGP